ncbi:reverse transcriptase domain-containing protein [Tanacetum coccineum]
MRTCAPYARREGFTPLTKTPKEILAMDNVNFLPPPPMVGTSEKRNMNKFYDYHQDRGHNTNDCYHLKKQIEEAVASGRLAHLVKDIRQGGQKSKGSAKGKEKVINMVRSQGYRKRPYERVEHWMDNAIEFSLVPRYQLMDCPLVVDALIEGFRDLAAHLNDNPESQGNDQIICLYKSFRVEATDDMEERRQLDKGKKPPKSSVEENIVVNDNYPEQLVTIRGGMSAECIHVLIHTLRKNVDIFAWTPADMTGISRAVIEHILDTYPHIEPKVQKKRSLSPDKRKVVTNEVNERLKAGIMTKKDEDKTAFHTEEGVFCYKKMPFGLKNAWATYQRTEQDIIKDIEQTFFTLQRINMKLNPKKCSLGMEEGKFLGYIVTSEGIRANPEKTKAVMDMPSPRTLKQMQSLNFRWTEVAEAAFLEMKLVSELTTLTTPKKGAEINYAPIEKLALALVHVARRLRRYFHAHPIKVITDIPIGQVLNNSGASRRLAKWAIELGAYGITYVPRVAVKGQVLADFLSDTSTEINAKPEVVSTLRMEDIPEFSNERENLTPGPRAWRLYTDGVSNNEGSGAGLILMAPDDVKVIHAFVDSKLVASQVEGSYEAKGVIMIKHQEKVLELANAFNRFRITHIPRAENKKADALSKLAAVQFDHFSKEVLVELLNECYVKAHEVNIVVEEEGLT